MENGRQVVDQAVDHWSLQSPNAGPWKTSFMFGKPEDVNHFMEPGYYDSDWG